LIARAEEAGVAGSTSEECACLSGVANGIKFGVPSGTAAVKFLRRIADCECEGWLLSLVRDARKPLVCMSGLGRQGKVGDTIVGTGLSGLPITVVCEEVSDPAGALMEDRWGEGSGDCNGWLGAFAPVTGIPKSARIDPRSARPRTDCGLTARAEGASRVTIGGTVEPAGGFTAHNGIVAR